ncbi:MAG TPA: hypothetical protein VFD50_03195 [Thermoleophilia bacterium]|nr:hypothetical protein [Thermoleophilia bacterium]
MIDVAEVTLTRVALFVSNMTFFTTLLPLTLKCVPAMTTTLPPETVPVAGLTAETTGLFFAAAKAETVPARPMTRTAIMARLTTVEVSVMARFTIPASK